MKCSFPTSDIEAYTFGFAPIDSRMYVLLPKNITSNCTYNAVIIDPCMSEDAILLLKDKKIETLLVILTHEHYDHISGVNFLRENFKITVVASEYCAKAIQSPQKNFARHFDVLFCLQPDKLKGQKLIFDQNYSCNADIAFNDKLQISFYGHLFKLVKTPGHSKGSICIMFDDSAIFTGDSLLRDAVILRLPGGNKKDYLEITQKLFDSLPNNIMVYPGHGAYGMISCMQNGVDL